jgi:BlaI family transcriptional regulator, penicillinase repressor
VTLLAKRLALSKGEMEVARVLWELGPSSVRQVFEGLRAERKVDFSTVQTYLRRLETKGYARSRLLGRVRVYRPRIGSNTVIRETVDELVDRLFGGEALPLFRHLIHDRQISAGEIQELRRMLDRRENGHASDQP